MCKSIAEGGKRCATHTRPHYYQALRDYFDPTKSRVDTMRAVIAFASTPKGAEEILNKINATDTDPGMSQWLVEARREGVARSSSEIGIRKALRKENKEREQRADILHKVKISTKMVSESEFYVLCDYTKNDEGYQEIQALKTEAEDNGRSAQVDFFDKILSRTDAIKLKQRIEAACLVECNRQGVGAAERQQLMYAYYSMLQNAKTESPSFSSGTVLSWGKIIEPIKAHGIRRTPVTFANGTTGFNPTLIQQAMDSLFANRENMTVDEFVKEFLIIHPFHDGNGRTAFVLYNALTGNPTEPVALPDYFA